MYPAYWVHVIISLLMLVKAVRLASLKLIALTYDAATHAHE